MRPAFVISVLLAAGLCLYATSLSAPFHFDDHHSIEYNPHIRSLTHVPSYFVDPSTFSSRARGYMYRPLLLTTYAVDHAAWGRWPGGYRITNLFLHVAMSALFGLWFRRLCGDSGIGLGAALLFLVHPAHSEAVIYISSRSDILVAVGYLAAFVCLSRGRQERGASGAPPPAAARAGLTAYAAALLSKSVAVTLPLVLWVTDAAGPGWRVLRRRERTWAALAGLTTAYLGALFGTRFLQASVTKLPRPWTTEIWTQVKSVAYYGWLHIMPTRLSVDHAFTVSVSPTETVVWLSVALALSLAVLAWRGRRLVPGLGLLWFGIVLLPYLLLPLNILVAERRTYAAGCGLFLIGMWAWRQAARRWALRPLAVAFVIALSLLTVERSQVWASQVTLWSDAVRMNPMGARARVNLALAYKRAGDSARAGAQLQRGLKLDPGFTEGWVALGELRQDEGDLDGALTAYRRAAALDPTLPGVQHNLGNVAMHRGRFDEAEARYRRTLELAPQFAEARNNLGQALEARGDIAAACAEYERAVADSALWTHTDDPVGGAWFNLGHCAERLDHLERARHAYAMAYELLRHDPRYADYGDRAAERLRVLAGEAGEP